ncbi:MAG: DHA2 family efflux MFS transporter permease subunit, partial [Proteobacteria bacterium]|nr:DHA2 family efflux MFS transporter permease subunit [Pseudomonadota bacterium]
QINWVLTSYIVAAAVMTPVTGWLAGRFGRKRLFLGAVVGFTMASVLCGLAGSLTEIVLARLLQGVFGAALVPMSQSVLLDTWPREKHGYAMAMWGVGVTVGPVIGPTLGGWLTDQYSWRWVFYINVPFGILALLGIVTFLTETSRNRYARFDWFGFSMLGVAVGSMQMMLDRGELLDWFGSTEIIVEAVLAGLCFYLFVAHSLTAKHPFVTPALFKDRNFVTGLFFMFSLAVVLFGSLALLSPFLQTLMNYPVATAGLAMAPRGAGTMFAMFVVGRMIGRIDTRYLLVSGFALTAWSLWLMTGFTPDVSEWTIIWIGTVQGVGFGLLFVPLSTITFATLAPQLRGEATGLFSLLRNLGGSIGISVVTSLLVSNTQVHHAEIANHVTAFNRQFESAAVLRFWNPFTPSGQAALNAEVTRQASMIAYIDDFKLMMIVALLSIPMVLLLRKPRPAPARPAAPD